MSKRLLGAITLGLIMTFSSAAYAGCGTVCDVMLKSLGCAPTGAQIKCFMGVNTILFHDDVQYSYACSMTCGNTAQVIFVPAKLDPISTRPWLGSLYNNTLFSATYQLPSFIRATVEERCDGSIVTHLPL
ncbi:MAG: hypothetical protein HY939_00730 [Gammaproteobacteria bacterium]|nr:hypothetical protein [Gammaproteobacteria bacterium]